MYICTMENLFQLSKIKSEQKSISKFTVYKGLLDNKVVYIGTTIQKPEDRFRWHRSNGKRFQFEIIQQFENEKDMLDLEFKLIKKLHPKYNKITHRRQNLNKKLTAEELQLRIGDSSWCQKCLKRHVNPGYKFCKYCS